MDKMSKDFIDEALDKLIGLPDHIRKCLRFIFEELKDNNSLDVVGLATILIIIVGERFTGELRSKFVADTMGFIARELNVELTVFTPDDEIC